MLPRGLKSVSENQCQESKSISTLLEHGSGYHLGQSVWVSRSPKTCSLLWSHGSADDKRWHSIKAGWFINVPNPERGEPSSFDDPRPHSTPAYHGVAGSEEPALVLGSGHSGKLSGSANWSLDHDHPFCHAASTKATNNPLMTVWRPQWSAYISHCPPCRTSKEKKSILPFQFSTRKHSLSHCCVSEIRTQVQIRDQKKEPLTFWP